MVFAFNNLSISPESTSSDSIMSTSSSALSGVGTAVSLAPVIGGGTPMVTGIAATPVGGGSGVVSVGGTGTSLADHWAAIGGATPAIPVTPAPVTPVFTNTTPIMNPTPITSNPTLAVEPITTPIVANTDPVKETGKKLDKKTWYIIGGVAAFLLLIFIAYKLKWIKF